MIDLALLNSGTVQRICIFFSIVRPFLGQAGELHRFADAPKESGIHIYQVSLVIPFVNSILLTLGFFEAHTVQPVHKDALVTSDAMLYTNTAAAYTQSTCPGNQCNPIKACDMILQPFQSFEPLANQKHYV